MVFQTKLILGSVLALLLGLTVSIPILLSNIAPAERIQIDVDVVYAYFGVQDSNRNVTGFWRNQSDPSTYHDHIISYFIVLNITNNSDKLATVDTFQVAAAPDICVQNGTETFGSACANINRSVTSSSGASNDGFGLSIVNQIVFDERPYQYVYSSDSYWPANRSRLIGLSGITEVRENAYPALENGTLYLYGEARGMPLGEKSESIGFSLKYVQLQKIGNEFLYNILVSGNQLLRINGLDVFVEPGH
jgi:hypothetical protein